MHFAATSTDFKLHLVAMRWPRCKTVVMSSMPYETQQMLLRKPSNWNPSRALGAPHGRLFGPQQDSFRENTPTPISRFHRLRRTADVSCVSKHSTQRVGDRLSAFETFVRDDTQRHLEEAQRSHDLKVARLRRLNVMPEIIAQYQRDLHPTHTGLVARFKALLDIYSEVRDQTVAALMGGGPFPDLNIDPGAVVAQVTDAVTSAKHASASLDDPAVFGARTCAGHGSATGA